METKGLRLHYSEHEHRQYSLVPGLGPLLYVRTSSTHPRDVQLLPPNRSAICAILGSVSA